MNGEAKPPVPPAPETPPTPGSVQEPALSDARPAGGIEGPALSGPVTKEMVMEALRTVVDWEINQNLVDLGLIYGVDLADEGKKIEVRMTLTTPYCPYGPQMVEQCRAAVARLPGVESVDIKLVWEPAWDPRTMASDKVKDALGLW